MKQSALVLMALLGSTWATMLENKDPVHKEFITTTEAKQLEEQFMAEVEGCQIENCRHDQLLQLNHWPKTVDDQLVQSLAKESNCKWKPLVAADWVYSYRHTKTTNCKVVKWPAKPWPSGAKVNKWKQDNQDAYEAYVEEKKYALEKAAYFTPYDAAQCTAKGGFKAKVMKVPFREGTVKDIYDCGAVGGEDEGTDDGGNDGGDGGENDGSNGGDSGECTISETPDSIPDGPHNPVQSETNKWGTGAAPSPVHETLEICQ